jgi:predicted phage-related endonuclease
MLSTEQIKARRGKLTASRIACLMQGDAEKIMQLWLEMTDDPSFVPEDLSRVWPVQLGACTEVLNLDWYQLKNNTAVTRRGEVVVHPQYLWAACTLDGWIEDLNCPIEGKHVGGREPLEVIIERYWPQMGWLMEVTGADQCALSVIMGANEPIVEFIPRDDEYIAEMIARGEQFMAHVCNRTSPVVLDAVPAPIDASRVYDMTGNNAWAASGAAWLSTQEAAASNKTAEKILKALVPEDAKKCTGHGVGITRDRAGRLSLREDSEWTR